MAQITFSDVEFGFQEIYLLHGKSILDSRYCKECDTSVLFGGRRFRLPIVPSNMKSVVNTDTCKFFAKQDLFYIMHRFGTDNHSFTREMHECGYYASISVGVNEDSKSQILQMSLDGVIPEYITIDVANAFSLKAKSMIEFIKDKLPTSFLIVGNYSTEEAVLALEEWGADATKCGISNGSVCTTYLATGVSRPQFSAVLACGKVAKKPVISDGAIRDVGDICKAIVAGATIVMAGGIFSGFMESAGDRIELEGKPYKQYFGSASYNNTQSDTNVEGTCVLVEYKGEMGSLLWKIEDGIRSCISYSGGTSLEDIRKMKWGVRLGGVRR